MVTDERTNPNDVKHEVLEGWVVDQACLRKYPQDEIAERARIHTKACSLMGHCIESGYGLVDDEGRIALLEPKSTPAVLAAIQHAPAERGIRLRASRHADGEEMRTTRVEEV